MTLIIGIKCSDGLVVAADGAVTYSAMGQPTTRQAIKKLTILRQNIVVGVSGSVGLGQRLCGVIDEMHEAKQFSGGASGAKPKPHVAMTLMRTELWKHVHQEMTIAQSSGQLIGQLAAQSAICESVVGIPLGHDLHLFHFDQQCAPTEVTANMPFITIGSGQKAADPFLGFIRRTLWQNKLPNLADATFAAYWTLDYAIQGDPGGVADPKQVITVLRDGSAWKAVELQKEALELHEETVGRAYHALRTFRSGLEAPRAGEQTTPPPSPPATA